MLLFALFLSDYFRCTFKWLFRTSTTIYTQLIISYFIWILSETNKSMSVFVCLFVCLFVSLVHYEPNYPISIEVMYSNTCKTRSWHKKRNNYLLLFNSLGLRGKGKGSVQVFKFGWKISISVWIEEFLNF